MTLSFRSALVALLLLLLLACGGEEEVRKPSGTSLAGPPTASTQAGPNRAPEIDEIRFEPASPKVDSQVRAIVQANDRENDRLSFRYEWRLNGHELVGTNPLLSTHSLSKGDELELTAVATDGKSDSSPMTRVVVIGNRVPLLAFVGVEPETGAAPGEELTAIVVGSDEDDDPLSYRYEWLRNGEVIEYESNKSLETDELTPGDTIQLRVVAHDGASRSRPTTSAAVPILNSRAPEIVSQPGGLREDGQFRYAVEARDPDGDEDLRFALLEAPDGMTIDEKSGEILWRPGPDQSGSFVVDVKVSDSHGSAAAQRFELAVEREAGTPPAKAR